MLRLHNFVPLVALLVFLTPFKTAAEDQFSGYVRIEDFFGSKGAPTRLTEDDIRDLPLTDSKLRSAYAWLVLGAHSGGPVADKRFPEGMAILSDLKRRGDSTIPIWLDIMAKNHNTDLEYWVPMILARVGTIKMEPFVEYFREMIRTRPYEISFATCKHALLIFFDYGSAGDVQMVRDLAERRPFLAGAVARAEEFQGWKNAPPKKGERKTAAVLLAEWKEQEKASTAAPASAPVAPKSPTSSPRWPLVTACVSTALGLLWFFLKRRSGEFK